jgi:hypothetical protein
MIFLSLDHFIFFYDLNHLIKTGEVRALKAWEDPNSTIALSVVICVMSNVSHVNYCSGTLVKEIK